MTKDRGILACRIAGMLAVAGLAALPVPRANAYLTYVQGSSTVQWKAASDANIWDDATKTLSWSLCTLNFPQSNWPTAAQAGAALQNSYQSHQDTIGTAIKFKRLPDTSTTPMGGDGLLQIAFCPDETPAGTYYGDDLSGAFAVTHTLWYTSAAKEGALIDADIEINGDGSSPFHDWLWTTGGPPPAAGSNDVEVTSVHEQAHSFGGGHPVYYYSALWWVGRYPELMMFDRCLGPDDRVLVRTLYPSSPALGTITGTVSLAAGGAVNKAVVVATDGNGIPQATQVTSNTGFYSINVPAGAGYTVTAQHHSNIDYNTPSDINFTGSTDFINSGTTAAFTVTAGATTTGHNFTVTGGSAPSMQLSLLAQSSVASLDVFNASQTLFFNKGVTYDVKLECPGAGTLTGVSMGPGITCTTGATSASNNPGFVVVAVNCVVDPAATAGCRNVSFNRGAERCFAPSFVEVLDTGTLTVAVGAQNPAAATAIYNAANQPLLQFTLAASPVEDIRIRKLQFSLAGAGPTLPNIHLWKDSGSSPGSVDGTDVPVRSGNAWSNASLLETIPGTTPGTIVFDNLCLTIPAGTTVPLLLTADMPASGSGGYTATFDPTSAANITAHGMFWGDILVSGGASPSGLISGAAVAGGTATIGPLAVGALSQMHTSVPQNVIPVGGSTDESQITLRCVATSSAGTVGAEFEWKPVGTAFNGAGTLSTASTFPSGTTCTVNATGLVSGQFYHWRARGLGTGGPSAWISFGGNAESEVDFTPDTSITPPPTLLQQYSSGGAILAVGGTETGTVTLEGMTSLNNNGAQPALTVRLEIEVQPAGTPFTGIPTQTSAFAATPTLFQIPFQGPTADYHWQARCATPYSSKSAFVVFNAAPVHFHLDAFAEIKASAGCIGRASETTGPWLLLAAVGVVLLSLPFRSKKAAATLLVLVCIGGAAMAAEDDPLPRSLADAYPSTESIVPNPEPVKAPGQSFMSVDAYLGALFMNMDFKATGTDSIPRKVSGLGTAIFGVEGLVDVAPNWRAGLAVEMGFWGDVQILGIGAVGSWRFAHSYGDNAPAFLDAEHYVRLGIFYEKLDITKSDFGNFDATVAVRVGYELRLSLGGRWFMLVGAHLQYSQWSYSPSVSSGDDKIGGFGGLITIGAAWLP